MLRVNGIERIMAAGNSTAGNVSDKREDGQRQQEKDSDFQKIFEKALKNIKNGR